MDNRWEYAQSLRNLDTQSVLNEFEYVGRLDVDFAKIKSDLEGHDWIRTDWYKWNWRSKKHRDQAPFPVNSSTKYVNKKQVLYSELPKEISKLPYEPFDKIAKDLGLYMPAEYDDTPFSLVKINRQMPGDMLWMHYDFMVDDDFEKYFVYLNDWAPGQVTMIGKHALTDWKSGDCYKVNVNNSPHGSVNFGPEERWLAAVRGKRIPNSKPVLTNKK